MVFLAIGAIIVALAFDFVNGFHDTANAVTTVIYTKALRPKQAILMSAVMNFTGALIVGTGVAKVIAGEVLKSSILTGHDALLIVVGALLGAIGWDLITWYFGLPISSSHALIGGLVGAGLAHGITLAVHNGGSIHTWTDGIKWGALIGKILLPLLISPIIGLGAGIVSMWIAALGVRVFKNFFSVRKISRGFRSLQIMSSAAVSFSHGSNDSQKTMGIITLILATQFPEKHSLGMEVPLWVMASCAGAMAMGTMMGGWRIIQTIGERIGSHRLTWMQGYSAESATATVILASTMHHLPVSTTHVLSSTVIGTNFFHGAASINMRVVRNIALAWIYTLPISAAIGFFSYFILRWIQSGIVH